MALDHPGTRAGAARGGRRAARAAAPRRTAGRARARSCGADRAARHPARLARVPARGRRLARAREDVDGRRARADRGRDREPPQPGARPCPPDARRDTTEDPDDRQPPAPPPLTAADFTADQLDLRERARRFVDELLIPNEELAERSGGRIPDELKQRIKREAVAAGLSGGLHAREHGGQGWTKTEWFLVEEQLGRSTNALSWHMPGAYNVLASGSPEQIERYLKPGAARRAARRLRGHRGGGGLRPLADRDHRHAHGGRLGDRRREVVRDLRRRRGRVHRDGERPRGRRAPAHAVPRRPRAARHRGGRRPALHPHLSARPSHHPLQRRRGAGATRSSAASAAARSCSAPGSPRSGSGSPPAAWARCGA